MHWRDILVFMTRKMIESDILEKTFILYNYYCISIWYLLYSWQKEDLDRKYDNIDFICYLYKYSLYGHFFQGWAFLRSCGDEPISDNVMGSRMRRIGGGMDNALSGFVYACTSWWRLTFCDAFVHSQHATELARAPFWWSKTSLWVFIKFKFYSVVVEKLGIYTCLFNGENRKDKFFILTWLEFLVNPRILSTSFLLREENIIESP
jgi:hypothetical protein